jgi:hydrogenase expression/formation protein HypC
MCLGIPMQLVEQDGNDGVAEAGGIRKNVRLDLIEDVCIGDYILIHTGYAIEKLDEREALETLELIKKVYRAGMTHDVDDNAE